MCKVQYYTPPVGRRRQVTNTSHLILTPEKFSKTFILSWTTLFKWVRENTVLSHNTECSIWELCCWNVQDITSWMQFGMASGGLTPSTLCCSTGDYWSTLWNCKTLEEILLYMVIPGLSGSLFNFLLIRPFFFRFEELYLNKNKSDIFLSPSRLVTTINQKYFIPYINK